MVPAGGGLSIGPAFVPKTGGVPNAEPAAKDCCWTPLVVMAPTCVSMFWRALKIPALARKADFPLPKTSHAKPRRGWNILFWLGIFPFDGKFGSLRLGE